MRILYSHRTRSGDGQAVHIEALTGALAAAGHDVMICGPEGLHAPGERAVPLTADDQAGLARYLPPVAYEVAEMGYDLRARQRLSAAARSFLPDVLYERYALHHHAGGRLARRLRLPFLLEVNAPLVAERAHLDRLAMPGAAEAAEQRIWASADRVLPVSGVLADMVEDAGVPRERIAVVPNGVDKASLSMVDPHRIRNRYNLNRSLVLGFVGFAREWHRLERVVDWLGTEAGSHARLMIVGDGPALATVRERAADAEVEARIIYAGVVPREEVPEYIAAFDIALQPAATPYASPLKLQEYMAQGRAIIAPDLPNIAETVVDGQSALLVKPDDKEALHAGLDRLAAERSLRERLGQAARATLLDRAMTWPDNAARVIALAEEVIEEKRQALFEAR